MRAIGLEKAAGAGLICLIAALSLTPVAALAQGTDSPSAASAAQATPAAPATPTAAPQPKLLNRAADAPQASATRYSRRHKSALGSGSGATAAPEPAAAAAAAATPAEIVCHAGCKQPGEVIFSPASAQVSVQTTTPSPANANDLTCVAGCYDGVTRISATSGAESSYMTTGARLQQGKAAASGEWMVKINRERGR